MIASYHGHAHVIQCLLHNERCLATLDYQNNCGCTALWHASYQGQSEVVRALLMMGADPMLGSNYHLTPLEAARNGGHADCVMLLEVGPPERDGEVQFISSPPCFAAI